MSDDVFTKEGEEYIDPFQSFLSQGATEPTQLDIVFEILSKRRRRYVLYCLAATTNEIKERSDEVTERPEIVEGVRTYEKRDSVTEHVSTEEALRIGLHHVQLPRLADAGVVDYDRRHGTVRYESTPALTHWLERAYYQDFGRTL